MIRKRRERGGDHKCDIFELSARMVKRKTTGNKTKPKGNQQRGCFPLLFSLTTPFLVFSGF
jgi:hypothetical protein